MKTAKQVIKQIRDVAVKEVGGVHFDREEAVALLALADYMGSGFVGEHTKTIAMIRRKVPR